MPQQRFTSAKYALGICDICSFRYPLKDLRIEPISAYGSPSNAPSGLKACPYCWDPPHPQSFLPLAVARHGADPEQVRMPRPDIFPIAYPVTYRLPNTIFPNSSNPLILAPGFHGWVNANGIFAGYTATVEAPPSGITINTIIPASPQLVALNLTVSGSMAAGTYTMAITDGNGNNLNGQITIS